MNASRMDHRRAIDWSAVDPTGFKLQNVIQGLLSRRSRPLSHRDIAKWFFATPDAFIAKTLADMLDRGACKAGGSSLNQRRVMHYWITGEYEGRL